MEVKPTIKALIVALAFLLIVVGLIGCMRRNTPERAGDLHSETGSVVSTEADILVTESDTTPYEPFTGKSEHTTAKPTQTYPNLPKPTETTTEAEPEPEYFDEEDQQEDAGDFIGHFELTAYEWTGEPMANGQYPYYGAVACNSLALGTVIYIEGYGTFTVCDRGGMGNNVIDIYLGDPYVCEQFGRRGANVYYAN